MPPAIRLTSDRTASMVATSGGLTAFSPASNSVHAICWMRRASGRAVMVAGDSAYCEPLTVCQRGMTYSSDRDGTDSIVWSCVVSM